MMATCSGFESRPPEDFTASPAAGGSAELCEQWLGLHRLPYPHPPPLCGVSLPPIPLGRGDGAYLRASRPPGGPGGHVASHWPPLFGTTSPFSSAHSIRGLADDDLVVRGRALQRTPLQDRPLPEPADEDLPAIDPAYSLSIDPAYSLSNILCSYNTPPSSGHSSPIAETQSTTSAFQYELTTGYTTERSNSSCYSLDDFERQASSTVHQHFEEFESMLYEGIRGRAPTASQECQEWITQFPHLRVLGKQILQPQDAGYEFVAPYICSTSRPSTSGTAELDVTNSDIPFTSDTQGLSLSGWRVKPSYIPAEVSSTPPVSSSSSQYNFLHEEVFEQDGIFEDIIAVDYKNIYEDNMEHKKQITPRRRRVGYPPITPNACVRDSVSSGVFDAMWQEVMSWLRILVRKYAAEILDVKKEGNSFSTGRPLVQASAFRAGSSFISRPYSVQGPHLIDGSISFDGVLKISTMILQNRNTQGTDLPDTSTLLSSGASKVGTRPSTVSTQTAHPRLRQGPTRSFLQPISGPFMVQDEKGSRQNPHDILSVRQIVPSTHMALPPSSLTRQSTLPPLETTSTQPMQRRSSHRASSAIDNKDGCLSLARERSNNNSFDLNRPSTTQAMRSETPFGSINRRSSTPLSHSVTSRYPSSFMHPSLNVTGSALHPLAEPVSPLPVGNLPADILEDPEGPVEDIRHNQWMPNTPNNKSYIWRMRPHLR